MARALGASMISSCARWVRVFGIEPTASADHRTFQAFQMQALGLEPRTHLRAGTDREIRPPVQSEIQIESALTVLTGCDDPALNNLRTVEKRGEPVGIAVADHKHAASPMACTLLAGDALETYKPVKVDFLTLAGPDEGMAASDHLLCDVRLVSQGDLDRYALIAVGSANLER